MSNKWNPITGLWENHYQDKMSISFQMTAAIKEKLNAVPVGQHIKLYPNEFKTEDKPTAPDWNMGWTLREKT